ncbi:SET-domain-containing histone methyltransferase-like protein [Dothistroma septosporum NZE10]|uniref:SET-domain-containing histone methyltransferase-like protein n=1 Tax=Dothistroma septosporum (strain NZE10 / CBS 128990) TaxID=675120 RepID=N1Q4I9_DOTSN|nr:SET-domain-containing histone methyltransferase-like protein [Dothistroma septosporum NZE10]
MIEVARRTPVSQAESAIRHKFMHMLRKVKGVELENKVDTTTPSLNFTFVNDYVLRDGIYSQPPGTFEGCVRKCKPDMGQNIGCEYTALCECLEYAAVDEKSLQKKDPHLHLQYMSAKAAGQTIDTTGMPKRFPYKKASGDSKRPQTLQTFYRQERFPIYECNDNCRCGPICKSRVVQKGRKVPLTVFKTPNRGWGVYCSEDLIQGEFIDTYLGEVITNAEADKREGKSGKEKNSYFYWLDKFLGDPLDGAQELTEEMCYVVDGQYMGNVTRFINHSCEPNCRQYTISYNKNDIRLYSLAFFAYEDIPAGTELTFDYQDEDEVEYEAAVQRREEAECKPESKGRVRCSCGAPKCRGFLW